MDRFRDSSTRVTLSVATRSLNAARGAGESIATFSVVASVDCAIWGDEAIFLDGEAVGYVTSGGFGPACEQHIALGYVNCDAYRPGGQYAVEVLGQLVDPRSCKRSRCMIPAEQKCAHEVDMKLLPTPTPVTDRVVAFSDHG